MNQKSKKEVKKKVTKKVTKTRSFSNNSAFRRAMTQMDVKSGETVQVVLENVVYTVQRT